MRLLALVIMVTSISSKIAKLVETEPSPNLALFEIDRPMYRYPIMILRPF